MKTLKIFMMAVMAVCFCSFVGQAAENSNLVEVIVFHGVKQCETCKAIKKNSEEVAATFKENAKGKVVYKVIDFSQEANKAIAEKYQIAWTSLVLVKHNADGEETVNNLSQYAIKNARTNTEEFRKHLAEEIEKMLK